MKKTLGKLFIGAVLLMAGMFIVSRCRPAGEGSRLKYYDGKWTNGGHYKGEMLNNQPHGFGTYTFASGTKYVGQFKDRKWEGQGTLTFADGRKFVAQFKDGNVEGQGTYTSPDGQKYVGQFKDNKYNGQGTLTLPGEGEYVGQFKEDMMEGQGTLTCSNGIFVGEMKENLGYKGTFTGKDGIVLTGVFHGEIQEGTIDYPDGRKYEGEWNGDPEFPGVVTPPDHWTYERPHGVGKMTSPDGKIEEGIWNKGKFLGKLALKKHR